LSTFILGFGGGTVTSMIAFLAILVRSGDVIGASMKGLAELSTVLGMFLTLIWLQNRIFKTIVSFVLGCISRVLVMVLANLLVLPVAYGITVSGVITLTPFMAVFNVIHGFLSMFGPPAPPTNSSTPQTHRVAPLHYKDLSSPIKSERLIHEL
jgi:riboflavin transporter FmnP